MTNRSLGEVLAGAVVLALSGLFLFYAVVQGGRTVQSGGIQLTASFDRVDGIAPGADVRIAGVKVGSVTSVSVDPETFNAVLRLRIDGNLRLPADSSAEIMSEGLLGGRFVAIVPGGAERILTDGGRITETQGSISLESLLGRFIFSVTQMNPAPAGAPAP
ncbi:MAG: outer membrane lipid asymmetry maintenance protein MlaD [Rhodovarius sp.]|nr:outer membrane lipid asymmetry maintenance protein MlaD [Rhodovarius sp.]MCX7932480.1 outer membrane lipid asymmetry maintenance protein MlaD [Rhodovarius sp.]MDW8314795.1 outer membrane lipid asymmetry maintenance protein MlaD [Rhodovarius sp.]